MLYRSTIDSWFSPLNSVVTGIRFLKKGGIIHIFISERELGPYGRITEPSTTTTEATTWKSDYNFLVDDSGVSSGRDYHTLTHENRAIDLDIIRAPIDEGIMDKGAFSISMDFDSIDIYLIVFERIIFVVVTGARFRFADGRLRFEIRTTKFDYKTGYLNREYTRSVWRGNNHYMEKDEKEKINIENSDVPTLSPQKSRRYRGDNQYIEFTPTDVHLDMAQTTGKLVQFGQRFNFHATIEDNRRSRSTIPRFPEYSGLNFLWYFSSSIHRHATGRSKNAEATTRCWHLL